jgi:ACR3 family arsenite transporter
VDGPGWLGLSTESLSVSMGTVATTVAVFLGIPLFAGYLTRTLGERARGRAWYEQRFLPASGQSPCTGCCSPSSSIFALPGKEITSELGSTPALRVGSRTCRSRCI